MNKIKIVDYDVTVEKAGTDVLKGFGIDKEVTEKTDIFGNKHTVKYVAYKFSTEINGEMLGMFFPCAYEGDLEAQEDELIKCMSESFERCLRNTLVKMRKNGGKGK